MGVGVGVGTENLDGVLVGTDGAVGAHAEEHGTQGLGILDVQIGVGQGEVGDVVVDADGEARTRLLLLQLVDDAGHHARGELLRRDAIAATTDQRHRGAIAPTDAFGEGGDDVEEERLTIGSGLLRAVQHGDGAGGRRDGLDDLGGRERAEQVYLDQTDLVAAAVEVVDGVLDRAGTRAHAHHDLGGLRVAVVLHQVVLTSGELGELVHDLRDDAGHGVVVRVGRLTSLEVGVGVLGGATDERVCR